MNFLLNILLLYSGPPTAPRPPLAVSEITSNSCKLSWKAPESDGGKPLKQYIVERRDSKRYTWTEIDTVRAKNTTLDVSRLLENVEYEFRVFAENEAGRSPALETKDKTICRKSAGNCIYLYYFYHCFNYPLSTTYLCFL